MQASLMFIIISVNFIVCPTERKLKFFYNLTNGEMDIYIEIVTRKEMLQNI